MRLLMIAPPGAGKGTQADRLAKRFDIDHVSSGELLRAEVEQGSDFGLQARQYLDAGDLVPDDVVLAMIMNRLVAADDAGGFVLDGFPRNLPQAQAAAEAAREDQVRVQAVINLEVSTEEVRRRLLDRAAAGGRSDDQEATIDHRLEVYDAQTQPLIEYYRGRGVLRTVDGEQPVDDVAADVLDSLIDLTSPG